MLSHIRNLRLMLQYFFHLLPKCGVLVEMLNFNLMQICNRLIMIFNFNDAFPRDIQESGVL